MWHYRPVKRKYLDGTIYFTVAEYFPKYGYTEDDDGLLRQDSYTSLIKQLQMMADDCKHYKIIDDTKTRSNDR